MRLNNLISLSAILDGCVMRDAVYDRLHRHAQGYLRRVDYTAATEI